MKPSISRIERMLEKIEAALVPPPRKWLRVIIHEGDDDEAEAKEKALAEHVARDDRMPASTTLYGKLSVCGRCEVPVSATFALNCVAKSFVSIAAVQRSR